MVNAIKPKMMMSTVAVTSSGLTTVSLSFYSMASTSSFLVSSMYTVRYAISFSFSLAACSASQAARQSTLSLSSCS